MPKSGHFLETLDIIILTQLAVIVLVLFLNAYLLVVINSLFIIDTSNGISIATHTYDVLGKKLDAYTFAKVRFVHIENVGV